MFKFKNKLNSNQNGFSLVEAILAVAITALIVSGFIGAVIYGQESTALSGARSRAVFLADEGLEVVRNIRDESFDNLVDGTYGLNIINNEWAFSGVSDVTGVFTREIIVSTVDAVRKDVVSRVTWQQNEQRDGLVSVTTRFINWIAKRSWVQTTLAEFNEGSYNSTESISNSDGEVQFEIEGGLENLKEYLSVDMPSNQNAEVLFYDDNILWIARDNSTLYKYDISDVSQKIVSELNTFDITVNMATGLYVKGGKAYVSTTDNTNEIVIIDLATDTIDIGIDLSGNTNATDVVVVNDKIFVSRLNNSETEFYVYNISGDILLGVVEVDSDVNALVVDSSYAYLATGDGNELWIVDYNDCAGGVGGNECTVVTQYNPSVGGNSDASAIFKVGDNIYLGRDNNYISSIDVSNPLAVSENYNVDAGNDAVLDVYADEDVGYIYVVSDDSNLEELNIIKISDQSVSEVNLSGSSDANAVIKQGAYLYIASDNDYELQILEGGSGGWSDLELKSTHNTDGGDNANDVFVLGNYAYVGTDDDFYVLDITDPNNVVRDDSIDFNFDINDVYVFGNYAYLATDDNGKELIVVDISVSTNIVEVGSFNLNGNSNALSIWVDGSIVYVGTSNNKGAHSSCKNAELYILDVTDINNISCSGSYDVVQNVNDVQISGNYAYLATKNSASELLVLDITTPASVTSVFSYNAVDDWNGVYIDGSILYGVANDSGADPDFYIFDITTPSVPNLIASYDTGDRNNDVKVFDGYAYLATNQNNEGLTVLNVSNPIAISQISQYDTASDCNGIDFDGNYVHLACENDTFEYYLIGKTAEQTNYSFNGWFTSVEFNSESANTQWIDMGWAGSGTGTIRFRLRTADDLGGVPNIWTEWYGLTGIDDYYTLSEGETINSIHSDSINDQWIQYRVYFVGDSITTPTLESVEISYN